MSEAVLIGALVGVPAVLLLAVAGVRRPVLAVCLVPVSFPIEQLELPGLPLRVVQFAALAAVGLVVTHQCAGGLPVLPRAPVLLAAGWFVVSALVSTVVAVDPAGSLRLDATYLLGFCFAASVALACDDRRSAQLLTGCTCAVGTVLCGAGIATATRLQAHFGATVVDNRATGFFGQPNELGAFAAVIVVLAIGLLLAVDRRDPLWIVAGSCVLTGVVALVVSLSRSSWLGFVAGLVLLLVLAPRARRPVVVALASVTAAVTAIAVAQPSLPLLSIVADRAASFVDGGRNPYDDRPAIWREALRQIADRPLLGSGPGGYHVIASTSGSQVSTVAPLHAHDLLLTVLAEQGLLGVLLLGITVGVGVAGVIRVRRRWIPRQWWRHGRWLAAPPRGVDRELLAGVAAALAAVLGQGVLDYPLRNPVLATMVWLLAGLLAAITGGDRDARLDRSDPGDLASRTVLTVDSGLSFGGGPDRRQWSELRDRSDLW